MPMYNKDKLYVSLECSINKSNQNICILCDSIIKEQRQALKARNNKVFVKSFPGATTTTCMNEYVTLYET